MQAIFSISAAPLLMLRGSSERKNDLQKTRRMLYCIAAILQQCNPQQLLSFQRTCAGSLRTTDAIQL